MVRMRDRVLIIGAGPSGLTTLKALLEVGITDVKAVDRNADVGGLWLGKARNPLSPVYDSLNIITSKSLSSFSDFPMPKSWPPYIPHYQVWEYHKRYAEHFNLYPYIQFRTEVRSVRRRGERDYEVEYADGRTERFGYVIVANGHHFEPNIIDLPGTFEGELLHARDYVNPLEWKGKRVLIIGAGNSGCDIAADACKYAAVTHMSLRRGYYIIPKFSFFGLPSDYVYQKTLAWLPDFLKKPLARWSLQFFLGKSWSNGMPKPDHDIFETHPLVNTELYYFIKHNRIGIKPAIQDIEGKRIRFVDGSSAEYDVVVMATGYVLSFPFLDRQMVATFYKEDGIYLYRLIFHPQYEDLFFVGLIQPDGNLWILSELQAKLIARKLTGAYSLPSDVEEQVRREVEERRRKYVHSRRHLIEVDLYRYRKALLKMLRS